MQRISDNITQLKIKIFMQIILRVGNAALRRKNSAYRRKTNTYATNEDALQRTLDIAVDCS
jgi:hypothetical protein